MFRKPRSRRRAGLRAELLLRCGHAEAACHPVRGSAPRGHKPREDSRPVRRDTPREETRPLRRDTPPKEGGRRGAVRGSLRAGAGTGRWPPGPARLPADCTGCGWDAGPAAPTVGGRYRAGRPAASRGRAWGVTTSRRDPALGSWGGGPGGRSAGASGRGASTPPA